MTFDARVEAVLGDRTNRGRAIVLLQRAQDILRVVEYALRGDAELEEVHTTIEILTGATSQAIVDVVEVMEGERLVKHSKR